MITRQVRIQQDKINVNTSIGGAISAPWKPPKHVQAAQPGLFAPPAVGEPLLAMANQRLQVVERTPTGIVRGRKLILPDHSALQFNAAETQRTHPHPFPVTVLVWQLLEG